MITAVPSPITLTEALEQYQTEYLPARNFAEHTRDNYTRDITDLLRYLDRTAPITEVTELDRRHLEGYLADLDRRGLKGTTRWRRYAAIRSFCGFLFDQDLIADDPTFKLLPPEREEHKPRPLSEREYKRLTEAVLGETRDAAIIELILQTGLRLSEVAQLRLFQLDLPAKVSKDATTVGHAHVVGKGRKDRTVTLNWKACRALKAYLVVRPQAREWDHVFLSKFREPLGPRAIQNLVKKYLKQAGIQDASVHDLRHTFATQHVRKGTRLEVVRQMLGHESLETTQKYISLAREEMDQDVQVNAL